MKAPIGNVIQAQKAGVLRGLVDANRAFSILIAGQPNDFSIHIGIGKWIQNVGVAIVESLIFSPLVFVVDGAEILWTTHVESGLARQIAQIVDRSVIDFGPQEPHIFLLWTQQMI